MARGQNQISGQVLGINNKPVADVYIELYNEVNRMVMRVKTDASGNFVLRGMGTGRFTVRARPFGTDYEEQSQEVTIASLSLSAISSSDSQQAMFFLRLRRDASTQSTPGSKTIFAQEVPQEAEKLYLKAIVELEAGRTAAGVSGLQSAVAVFSEYFLANERLGVEMLKQTKYEDALAYFKKAVTVNPRAVNSWYGVAYCSNLLERISESVEAAKKAVVLSPESADIAVMLGIAQRKAKNYEEAETQLLRAKKLSDNTSADASWNLALLYAYNLKKYKAAADELENYLRIKPEHPDAEKLRKLIAQYRVQ